MSQTNCSVYIFKSNWSVSKRTASLSQDRKESTADALCDYQNLTHLLFECVSMEFIVKYVLIKIDGFTALHFE